MNSCAYGAYGYRVALTIDVPRAAYAGYVCEVDLSWYVLGMRIYIPWLRRFIGVDALSPFGAGGLNRYAYCVGDPINHVDPSGQSAWKFLGSLLGRIGSAIGKGMDMVSQVTPTTALTRIGAVADVVAVGTTIGAVAAGALGDESSAGLLGWIAAGSGLAGVGLGMAGAAVAKGARRGEQRGGGSSVFAGGDDGVNQGQIVESTKGQMITRRYFIDANRTVDVIHGTPEYWKRQGRTVRKGRLKGEKIDMLNARWAEAPGGNGSVHYLSDSPVNAGDVFELIKNIGERVDSRPIYLLTGAHGDASGENWGMIAGKGRRKDGDERLHMTTQSMHTLFQDAAGRGRPFFIVDIGDMPATRYADYMHRDAHVIHGFCFSGADWKVMKELGVGLATSRVVGL